MEFKVVICDPESGRSYQRELKDEKARRLKGMKLGNEFDGSVLGLMGYKLKITGGSDKSGFPMKKGVHGTQKPRILMSGGVGYKPRVNIRKRKHVRGENIDEDIVQINTKVVKRAKKSIEELLGLKKEEIKEKPEEKVEEVKDEVKKKPKEKKKVEVKEVVKEEKPEEKKPHEAKVEEKPPASEKPRAKKSKVKKSKEEKGKTEE